jgi:hypothetical protein
VTEAIFDADMLVNSIKIARARDDWLISSV